PPVRTSLSAIAVSLCHQLGPRMSPALGVIAAFHVSSETAMLTLRTLPSSRPTGTIWSKLRRAETPLTPPQLTSGRSSLIRSRPLNVPCRKRPSIQLAQRSPAMFLPSLKYLTPEFGPVLLRSSFFSSTYCRRTSVAAVLPSPLSVSPDRIVLLVPSVID